jgi:kynurenine 3-monooxygenase
MDLAIVGGGLAGSLAAVFLGRRGHTVTLYERRDDPRLREPSEGRSINLALSARGIDALQRVGLDQQVLSRALPMYGRMMHGIDGQTNYQAYSADGKHAINSVSRSALNEELLSAAQATTGVSIRFGCRIIEADPDTGDLTIESAGGLEHVRHDAAIGTDGAYSAVRDRIVHASRTSYQQDVLPWGYKELSIPAPAPKPAAGDGFPLDPKSLHIWPRQHSMMIALPNPDRSFTATLFWPIDGPHGFSELTGVDSESKIVTRFLAEYSDVIGLMPNLISEYQTNRVGTLLTVRVWPWTLGRLGLLGDAAHAIVPFFGQGMNCSFEDVVELDRCLDITKDDVVAALAMCADQRKPNADAIAEMALENFVEMRDRVGSRWFRLATEGEHKLERLAPTRFKSRYEMISFSTIPYAEAKQRAERQRRALLGAVDVLDKSTNRFRTLFGRTR